MLGTHDLWLFALSGVLLNITPGPDTLYILARASQGLRAGAVAALGIGAGILVHVSLAALGLSALLAASAAAFAAIKLVGAVYLVYVGISLLFSNDRLTEQRASPPSATTRTVFLQGFLTNVLNPKVALFFLAFLPQFVDPSTPDKAMALFFLGLIFDCSGTLWNLFVAWSAARLSRRLMSKAMATWLNRSIGALFVLLAARLALARQP